MKKTNQQILIVILVVIYNACASTPASLAKHNPEILTAHADSLLNAHPDDAELKLAIISAKLNLAKKTNNVDGYHSVLKIDPKNASARYHIHMAEGKEHHTKSHKNAQWDAIQSFAKAATAIDTLGEPYYWMGLAYEKKDEMDFELSLEVYDKALNLYLPQDIHTLVIANRKALLTRKKTYEDFWK
tara:strand:- start:430 stop:987 length:558 start_codon:yes stop_codon:yes gene_type:complete